MNSFLKGKFHDHFFRRKAQNLRAEIVLGMRIEILIFATKKIALRQRVEPFSTHWRNKKPKPIKFKHFYKKPLTSLFLHISKSKQEMEIQNTLFVAECTRAKILRRAKIGRAKFFIKNMSWNLPLIAE